MDTFFIGDLQVQGQNARDNYFLDSPIEGLEFPTVRLNNYDKPGEDGGVISTAFYGTRHVTLTGTIRATSQNDYETKRRTLANACAISRDQTGLPSPTRFTFTLLGGGEYYFDGYIQAFRCPKTYIPFGPYFVDVLVPDPMIFGSESQTTGENTRLTGGGFILPVILPITPGTAQTGQATATNNGNTNAYPIITIRGDVTSPIIRNTTTGEYIQLNLTTDADDEVVIDMMARTITLNGSSAISTKTSDSSWWALVPGDNTIIMTTSDTGDTGTFEVEWFNAFLGV